MIVHHFRIVIIYVSPPESVKLRLMSGSSRCAGRLDVYYMGIWGTVVVCRIVNCSEALDAPPCTHFGGGSGPVVTGEVECHDSEAALQECRSAPWDHYLLPHIADAGIICSESVKLRLMNGGSRCAGRLEVHYVGSWWTVHDNEWDLQDATVVCRELGCGEAVDAPGGAHFGEGSEPAVTYKVQCNGNEATLRECKSEAWANYGMFNSNHASVICSDHRVPRLVSESDECSGRLEVQFGKNWEWACVPHWDMEDANVVCSQLQCGVAVSVLRGAHFEEGNKPSQSVECQGNESTLSDCPISPTKHYCNHMNNIIVICSGKHGPRLVDGENRCSGRVEVLHGDQWGTICDEYFSLEDAAVVCEQLQCGGVNASIRNSYSGEGNGPMWKDDYRCLGNESKIADCPVSAWGQIRCSRGNEASLICTDDLWTLRLNDGGSRCDGQVEVYDNGTWHRVQDHHWSIKEANVVCRQLRCGSATSTYNSSRYPENERPVWVTEVRCEGSESHLRSCRTTVLNRSSSDITDIGVLCSGHLQLRLSGSDDACAGRLEFYYNGSWGTVCDDSWDLVDANVVCRQLGCGYALEEKYLDFCVRGTGEVWLDEVRCSGNESHLWKCPSAPWGQHDCSHKEDVIVTCSEHKEMCLMNGDRRCEGRVEVLYNGTWGTICSESLNENTANLICKQMKCGPMISVKYNYQTHGEEFGPIWLDQIKCSSYESTIWQCHAAPWGNHSCDPSDYAGIVCEEAKVPEGYCGMGCDSRNIPDTPRLAELSLRLFSGNNNCSGRLEIFSNNTWGTVCDDSWNLADADVVCRQLRCGSALWTTVAEKNNQGVGDIWLDEVKCKGSESFLSSCPSSPLGQHDCDHKEDVFVVCSVFVAVCVTLGIVLVAELFALKMIIRRQSARIDALLGGVNSPDIFYQAIYEEIENTPRIKKLDFTGHSDFGSIDSMNQIDYYSSDPFTGTVHGPECTEGNPCVCGVASSKYGGAGNELIDSLDAPVLMTDGVDNL
ncbi:scavenger receptor cysteine-rich type 1 protein M130-like [Hemitrygon akajei]|uniref:scavenger receptor cysteine-rich type 1 protein M130-like n=1 Tax=Hemitrygon akajei TaxID=2704970 RepID=UPI003BFA197B